MPPPTCCPARVGGVPVEPKLPVTAAAVADAAIGAADVAVIRSILARIPPHLGEHKRAEVEAELARHARTLDAGQLAILGRRILAYLDQDGRRPNDTPGTRRSLRFHDRDGGYELAGWLDREAAEILRSALSPLDAPRHRHRDRPAHRGATRRRRPGRIGPTRPERRRAAYRGRGTPAGRGHCQLARTARPDRLSPAGVRWARQCRCRPPPRLRRRGHSGGAGFAGRTCSLCSNISPPVVG
jgi:hypothetical protein